MTDTRLRRLSAHLTSAVQESFRTDMVAENSEVAFCKAAIELLKCMDARNGVTLDGVDQGERLLSNIIKRYEARLSAITGEPTPALELPSEDEMIPL